MEIKDRSDMSEDYEKNDGIPPFIVNSDLSILLNSEDTPWLRCDHNQGTYVKKKFIIVPARYGDVLDLLCNNCALVPDRGSTRE